MFRITILLIFSLIALPTVAKSTVFKNVKDLKALTQHVASNKPPIGTTLVIFDIDDTLLEANNFVGSSKWYNWQRGKVVTDFNGVKFTIKQENKFSCIFRSLSTLFELASTRTTQPDISNIMTELSSYDLMLLTARTTSYRAATERELEKNSISFSDQHLGNPNKVFNFRFDDGKRTANVTYQNGMIMASGLNKGLVLETMLKRLNKNYQQIYFIDDSQKNITDMNKAWKEKSGQMHLFHYTRVDKSISKEEIKQSVFAKKYFDQFISSAYPDSFEAFQREHCQ